MENNSGYFDDVISLVREDPGSTRANLLFTALRTAHSYRIVPFITESGMQALGADGREELEKIKNYLRLSKVKRDELQHELESAYKEALEIVMGVSFDEI